MAILAVPGLAGACARDALAPCVGRLRPLPEAAGRT
jgi:hypothetical protein